MLLISELVRFGRLLDDLGHCPVADAAAVRWAADRPTFLRSSASHVLVARRPLIKDMHFWGGVGWISMLVVVVLLGVRRGLLRAARELERFDHDRLNVGQKINAILMAAFTILFLASGLLLWYGERDTRFHFASTVVLHDGLMFVALALFVGHLYLAVLHPATRHSLRGMTRGTVSEDWARRHYPRWTPPPTD